MTSTLRAARLGRDEDDIAVLLRRCDVRSLAEAKDVLDGFYDGEEELKPVAEIIVNDALSEYRLSRAVPPVVLPAVEPR